MAGAEDVSEFSIDMRDAEVQGKGTRSWELCRSRPNELVVIVRFRTDRHRPPTGNFLFPHPLTMSLRLAARTGRLLRTTPARQATVGAACAARRIHSSQSAKGSLYTINLIGRDQALTSNLFTFQLPLHLSPNQPRQTPLSLNTPRLLRSFTNMALTSCNACLNSSSSSPCLRTS